MPAEFLIPRAVLDANILYSVVLTDVLLTLSEAQLFQPLWSQKILEEAQRNAVKRYPDKPGHHISSRFSAMVAAFPGAMVPPDHNPQVHGLPDPDDEHVLQTAIAGSARVIVTFNLKDFPPTILSIHRIKALTPGQFLTKLYEVNPQCVNESLGQLVEAKRNPRITMSGLLETLARAGVPELAVLITN